MWTASGQRPSSSSVAMQGGGFGGVRVWGLSTFRGVKGVDGLKGFKGC